MSEPQDKSPAPPTLDEVVAGWERHPDNPHEFPFCQHATAEETAACWDRHRGELRGIGVVLAPQADAQAPPFYEEVLRRPQRSAAAKEAWLATRGWVNHRTSREHVQAVIDAFTRLLGTL